MKEREQEHHHTTKKIRKLNSNWIISQHVHNAKERLSTAFTSTEMDYIFEGKLVSRWKEEDISHAMTLRNLTPKGYQFMRNSWGIPLPSRATLSRWVSSVDIQPGILTSVISLMQHKAKTMEKRDCVCVLSFDECLLGMVLWQGYRHSIWPQEKCSLCNDQRFTWPMEATDFLYDFDRPMTKDLPSEIIQKVETVGFPLVAVVSDQGSSNLRRWKYLEVTEEKNN